jgi:large subunit ribosomal protein L30
MRSCSPENRRRGRKRRPNPPMSKLKITQTRSQIGQTQKHRGTLRALGLGKIGRSVEREDTPETLGMLRKVRHLVRVDEE